MIVRKNSVIAMVVAAVFIATGPSFAGQGRGSGGPKTHPPKPTGGTHTTVAKGPSAGTVQHGAPKGPKSTSTMAGGAAKGPKTTSTSPKSGTASAKAGGKSTTTASAKTTASANKTTASAKKTEPAKTTTTTSGAGTTSTTTTLTPVQQKLQQNTNLASKLETRLPKGTDLMTAAEGFRNLGQFVAAVNVSNNLGIDFVNLKTSMVDDGLSLGQAIQTWKPTANSTQQASLAESQATVLINTSSTTTTATTTTTTAKTKKPKSTSGGGLND
jgi:hypothetical protein